MRFKKGKLYQVKFKFSTRFIRRNRYRYEIFKEKGFPITTNYLGPIKRMKEGDILLFIEKGPYRKGSYGKLAYTPYVFIWKGEIITYEKRSYYNLNEIFEELEPP